MITYNFYSDEKGYYIILDKRPIEVTKEIYTEYKRGIFAINNSDRKYYTKNESLDDEISYDYPAYSTGLDMMYIEQETEQEFFRKLNENTKKILLLLIEGYTENEIASSLSVSRQYVNRKKNELIKLLH